MHVDCCAGIPAVYTYMLWINKHKSIVSDKEGSSSRSINKHEDPSLQPIAFLWKSYRPMFYYWEVIECMWRLLLTGQCVFEERLHLHEVHTHA
jgi:hypothetical protein